MIRFFCKLWCDHLRPFWSQIRWCGKRKVKGEEVTEKITPTITSVRSLCQSVDDKFRWTMDDFSQLFDSLRPCEYLYNWYKNATKETPLKDDCDGYHSLIYHILTANGFDCCLFTIVTNPVKNSHTMTLYKYNNMYYLIDYTSIREYSGCTIQGIVDDYNKRHGLKKEHYWNTQRYDYEKKKFVNERNF